MHRDSLSGIKATQSLIMKRKISLDNHLAKPKARCMPAPDNCKMGGSIPIKLQTRITRHREFVLDKLDGSDESRYHLIATKRK